MRGLAIVALLLVGALTLSGCSSKGDSSSSTSGSKSGTRNGTNGTHVQTNTTTLAPNVPPTIQLHVTNATGVVANYTFVKVSLTFSAEGSSDPDGDGLSAIAIVAQDSNKTYAPGVLFGGGRFSSVTYTFDRPGAVNVTVSGIDGRGDLTTITSKVYVDEKIPLTSQNIAVASVNDKPSAATDCEGPGSHNQVPEVGGVLDAESFTSNPFNVVKGVQFIDATLTSGGGAFAICFSDATAKTVKAVSPEASSGTVTTNVALKDPVGLDSYSVGFTTSTPNKGLTATVVVHYEPKPAK